MGRILGIDYGLKRCGIAVSDPLQIIATPLETLPTVSLIGFLNTYIAKENVTSIVLGMPLDDNNLPTDSTAAVIKLVSKLEKLFPNITICTFDERYTSKIAKQALHSLNLSTKKKKNKLNIDKIAASVILRDFLEYQTKQK